MEFWTSLIKTPGVNQFLEDNCTHVTGEYWIFEGDNCVLEDELKKYEIIAEGAVPSLGGLTETELVAVCEDRYGIDLANPKQEDI